MAVSVKWPHLLQNYFSVTLSPDQQQIWQGELADETNDTICAAIRWAAKNWKRPDYCQINITTLQAWLYKSKNGLQEERVQREIEYLRKVDGIVADLCGQVDAAPKEGGKMILRTLINGICSPAVQARVAEHASLRGYDWWQDSREQAKREEEVKLTPLVAITKNCQECLWETDPEPCTPPKCALFPFRTGESHSGKTMKPEHREAARLRMKAVIAKKRADSVTLELGL